MCHLLIHVVAGHNTARSRHLRDRASEHLVLALSKSTRGCAHAKLGCAVSFPFGRTFKGSRVTIFSFGCRGHKTAPSHQSANELRSPFACRRLEGQRGPKRPERRMEAQGDPERPRRPRERPGKAQKRPREARREANRGVPPREGPERLREIFGSLESRMWFVA